MRGAVQANASNAASLRRQGRGEDPVAEIRRRPTRSTGATGQTRVAWTVIGKLPVVQCVEVRRTGNFLTGITVTLLSLSAPIPNEADC